MDAGQLVHWSSFYSNKRQKLENEWLQANLFIGLGLLSSAYALKMGGWVALLGLAANAACFALAGECIISDCTSP